MLLLTIDEITKRHGANLPHWTRPDSIYFVTFRQEDSVPLAVLEEMKEDQAREIRTKERTLKRALTPAERPTIVRKHRRAVEDYLDGGRGSCLLAKEENAKLLEETMLLQRTYELHAWSVMPNHAHAVLAVADESTFPKVMHSWKSFTSTMINRNEVRKGQFWQTESYDHLVRDEEDLIRCCRYVLNNPAKAGLPKRWTGCSSEVEITLRDLGLWE